MSEPSGLVPVRFYSPHPPEECVRRLRETTGGGLLPQFSGRKVAGRVTESAVSIVKNNDYNNCFQPCLKAGLLGEGGGTLITGALGPATQGLYFSRLWFLGAAVVTVYLWSTAPHGGESVVAGWARTLAGPVLMALGWVMAAIGHHVSRNEGEFLKSFIIEVLDARELTVPSPFPPRE